MSAIAPFGGAVVFIFASSHYTSPLLSSPLHYTSPPLTTLLVEGREGGEGGGEGKEEGRRRGRRRGRREGEGTK